MKSKKWQFIFVLLSILVLFQNWSNRFTGLPLLIMFIGVFVLRQEFIKKHQSFFWWSFSFIIIYLIFKSPFLILITILFILYFMSNHPKYLELFASVFSKKNRLKGKNDFIMVDFYKEGKIPNNIIKNKWIGTEDKTVKAIYSWEDVNFTKLIGNSVFDLANTLLPREQNIILIRQGIGNVKILIPEGTAVAIDFSGLVGKFILNHTEYSSLNENFKWYSDNYLKQDRKVKIVVNLIIGELEVIFL